MVNIPLSTYRLQLFHGFTFNDAIDVIGYLSDLGIGHVYTSPYLQASPGSTHGYDVVDHNRINEELGGAETHQRFCKTIQEYGMGHILDIVPNHMAITGGENAWWWDVLENGPSSQYAAYFDVDWTTRENRFANKILLPILGNHYGRVLEAGELTISREDEMFQVCYYEHVLPIDPRTIHGILSQTAAITFNDELAFMANAFKNLPLPTATDRESTRQRHRDKEILKKLLKRFFEDNPEISATVDSVLNQVNTDPNALDEILEGQNYRLAYWRMAGSDLGYRRFFDINSLVGLKVEDETVFEDTHRLIFRLLEDGLLDGIRIDHPDGLYNPEQYLQRIRQTAPNAWVILEKILHPGEELRASWPVQGTVGYDFLNTVNRLFLHADGKEPLTDFYKQFTGEEKDYEELLHEKKQLVLKDLLGSELHRLADLLIQICETHRSYRDYDRVTIETAISEVVACFPVYRTYVIADANLYSREDEQIIQETVEKAKARQQEIDTQLFDFIKDLLLLVHQGELENEFTMRFQQLTGPVMAKGAEDTAFYCYNRFVALNEVGGNPDLFENCLDDFHDFMKEASRKHPYAMLCTSTHDTKRSEDVRTRLAVLSEMPKEWQDWVNRWAKHNESYRQGNYPDRNTEYLLYQTLVGTWPISQDRLIAYMEKAVREAKTHTTWTRVDEHYENCLRSFIEKILADAEFINELEEFIQPVVEAGRLNSLSQTLIKLTAPGVPDIYQGTDLWDYSLVDPDNRRPVDFQQRRKFLGEVQKASPEQILARMEEGLPKLWLIHKVLQVRNTHEAVFKKANNYTPLFAKGKEASSIVAYMRGESIIAVAPRFYQRNQKPWEQTTLEIRPGNWRDVLTGETVQTGLLHLNTLLERFPVALLVNTQ